MSRPSGAIAGVEKAHRGLLVEAARVSDPRIPSRLPGWTLGHLLTHLARNADGLTGLFEAATAGRVGDMYPGGPAQRAVDIEAGATRPIGVTLADLAAACERLEGAWDAAPSDLWAQGRGRVTSGVIPLTEVPCRRRREVEVHRVDLGLGYRPADWPADYVAAELADLVPALAARLGPGVVLRIEATDTAQSWTVPADEPPTAVAAAPSSALVAWLLGRGGADLPALAPWQPEHRH